MFEKNIQKGSKSWSYFVRHRSAKWEKGYTDKFKFVRGDRGGGKGEAKGDIELS